MTVERLIHLLRDLPGDALVYVDIEDYPSVDGAYAPDPDLGPEDAPRHAVLLEVIYPVERDHA